jgi:hypothetical protein
MIAKCLPCKNSADSTIRKQILKILRNFPFHPLLWAVFPPLALLGNNISQVPPGDAVRSLLVSFILSLVLWVIYRPVMGSWRKSAIVASATLVLFFSYGHIYQLIEDKFILGFNIGRHRFLIPLFVLMLVFIIVWTIRRKDLPGITAALNIIGLLVLILPAYQIISYEIKTSPLLAGTPQENLLAQVTDLQNPSGNQAPDIYYIILDTYTRADTLSTYFTYDNSSFLTSLESHGFYIADCSQSNYSYTALSLASSLNFNYLNTLNPNLTSTVTDETDIYPYLFNNSVVYTLRQLGYQFVAFESGYSPTEFTNADTYYSQESDLLGIFWEDGINPFEAMQLNTSAGMFIYELSPHFPARVQQFLSLDTAYVVHRNRILYTLNRLERIASLPGPKFVFVHILAPHNPFVFGPNGEYIERKTPFTLNDDRDVVTLEDYIAGYDDQVTYLNQRVLSIIEQLITGSAVPPVIILQGDHGVPRLPGWNDTILNAYFLPGGGENLLYQGISPVNSFRVVFDQYFGGQLPLLPDQSCTTDAKTNPFGCTPEIDPNPQCVAVKNR